MEFKHSHAHTGAVVRDSSLLKVKLDVATRLKPSTKAFVSLAIKWQSKGLEQLGSRSEPDSLTLLSYCQGCYPQWNEPISPEWCQTIYTVLLSNGYAMWWLRQWIVMLNHWFLFRVELTHRYSPAELAEPKFVLRRLG